VALQVADQKMNLLTEDPFENKASVLKPGHTVALLSALFF
jgi:hypothetical protein